MKKIIITKKQFEKLREVFDMYDLDRVTWIDDPSLGGGIGSASFIEFDPKSTIKIDITDVESW